MVGVYIPYSTRPCYCMINSPNGSLTWQPRHMIACWCSDPDDMIHPLRLLSRFKLRGDVSRFIDPTRPVVGSRNVSHVDLVTR